MSKKSLLRDAISYIPEQLRGEKVFQYFCELVDFVIDEHYIPDLSVVNDQLDIESDGYDNEWVLDLLGAINLTDFDPKALDNRTYSYLVSAIDEMKGNVQGLLFALSLFGVHANIYQWYEINRLIASGDTSWGTEPYPAFSVVVEVRVDSVEVEITPAYEIRLRELCRKLLWACIVLIELRLVRGLDVERIRRPRDYYDYSFGEFVLEVLGESNIVSDYSSGVEFGYVERGSTAVNALYVGDFYVGSPSAVITDADTPDSYIVYDRYFEMGVDVYDSYIPTPESHLNIDFGVFGFSDVVNNPVDVYGYGSVELLGELVLSEGRAFVGGAVVDAFTVAPLSGSGVLDTFTMRVEDFV